MSGTPHHSLTIKIGTPVMCMRNIDQKTGLCVVSPSDTKLPFKLNRRQFPVQICFGMTVNKSQGQTLSKVGLFLPRPVFSHGQLYVVSMVKSRKGLKILCSDIDGKYTNSSTNVVYK